MWDLDFIFYIDYLVAKLVSYRKGFNLETDI